MMFLIKVFIFEKRKYFNKLSCKYSTKNIGKARKDYDRCMKRNSDGESISDCEIHTKVNFTFQRFEKTLL